MTSAAIVLPVPESPANRAVTPMPRPPPGRIRQSDSTRSRLRARWSTPAAAAGPYRGARCRATKPRARYVWPAVPGPRRSVTAHPAAGRDRRRAARRTAASASAAVIAAATWRGPNRYWAAISPTSMPSASGPSSRRHRSVRSATVSREASAINGTPVGPVRIPSRRTGQDDGHRQPCQAEDDVDGVYTEGLDGRYDQARATQQRFASQYRRRRSTHRRIPPISLRHSTLRCDPPPTRRPSQLLRPNRPPSHGHSRAARRIRRPARVRRDCAQ